MWKFGPAAEDGEAGGVGRCDPYGFACLLVDGRMNFIGPGAFG